MNLIDKESLYKVLDKICKELESLSQDEFNKLLDEWEVTDIYDIIFKMLKAKYFDKNIKDIIKEDKK